MGQLRLAIDVPEVLEAIAVVLAELKDFKETVMASFDELYAKIDAVAASVVAENEQVKIALEAIRTEVGAETATKLDEAIGRLNNVNAAIQGIIPDAPAPEPTPETPVDEPTQPIE